MLQNRNGGQTCYSFIEERNIKYTPDENFVSLYFGILPLDVDYQIHDIVINYERTQLITCRLYDRF